MANLTFEHSTLKIVYEMGVNESNETVLTTRSYRNVRDNVTAEQLASVVQAFIQLSKHPVVHASISKTEKIEF
ncbi:DUF1659 domain-containing protein [Ureibacillus thermophilus]|uniref:DUF1659 domain-containing protein n=1 Tax=Ureibacillus thermophilus TaxID=367743 RepID=A0A4P6UWW0_9BACL|nr:DUF1659 domain-containing protein [Ureibacillus thermophilus]QBK26182.1 DUF1659 domain-containing protein [Ureibacillus thermophilus]